MVKYIVSIKAVNKSYQFIKYGYTTEGMCMHVCVCAWTHTFRLCMYSYKCSYISTMQWWNRIRHLRSYSQVPSVTRYMCSYMPCMGTHDSIHIRAPHMRTGTHTHMGKPGLAHNTCMGSPYMYGQPICVWDKKIAHTRIGCPYAYGTANMHMGKILVCKNFFSKWFFSYDIMHAYTYVVINTCSNL